MISCEWPGGEINSRERIFGVQFLTRFLMNYAAMTSCKLNRMNTDEHRERSSERGREEGMVRERVREEWTIGVWFPT